MRKFGKYEKMRKNAILQTYITSLLCLLLCVTMFFGTSMAWFSDTAESTYNEMYVGTLEIELNHATFKNGAIDATKGTNGYVAVDGTHKILDESIKWEPGYTAVEKFELIENGDLAFSYQMGIECEFDESTDENGVVTTAASKEAIAGAITVWNYTGKNAENYTLPANFDVMKAADWEPVGTLLEVIEDNRAVFSGEMEKDKVNATTTVTENDKQTTVDAPAKAYHIIALHMEETFADSSVQGKTLDDITIKLVATQKPSEQDAFGSNYDKDIILVNTTEELEDAIEKGATNILLGAGNFTVDLYNAANRDSLTITGQGADTKIAFKDQQVRASQFKQLKISNCTIERMPDKNWGHLVFGSSTVEGGIYTISNCVFNGDGSQGIYINQDIPATFNIENCTFNGDFGNEGAITIQNNENVNITVNVTGCTFNNIPETSHKIFVHYAYNGWTLNVDKEADVYWKAKA